MTGILTLWTLTVTTPAYGNPIAMPMLALPAGIVTVIALGIAVECATAALFGVRGRVLGVVATMNLVSIPLLNLAVILLTGLGTVFVFARGTPPWAFALIVLTAEVAVIAVEGRILARRLDASGWSRSRTLILAAVMNVASFAIGYALFRVLPYLSQGSPT